MARLEEISQQINGLSLDLKAETVVALLFRGGVDLKEILASYDGQHRRVWSDDIEFAEVVPLSTGDELLSVHLNRDGLYDVLPESLFHSQVESAGQTGVDMARESMKLRNEERETRMFFQPVETEIFLQRAILSLKEFQLFESILADGIMGIIPDFWNMDFRLPDMLVNPLVKLLALAGQVAGKVELTARSLEFILGEKVTAEKVDSPLVEEMAQPKYPASVLGECYLGVDSIAGNMVNGFISRVIFSIGPLVKPNTFEWIKNGKMERFLQTFYGYFVPVELDIQTRFVFSAEQSFLQVPYENDQNYSYLGYNSILTQL